MKSTTVAAAALAIAAVASADPLQINNPTVGTTWKVGETNFIGWTGNCAFMGNESKSVLVDLMKGPSTSLLYVASLQPLDCSSTNVFRANVTLPTTVPSGNYSIRVQTSPPSYSNVFTVVNPADATPSPTGGVKPPTETQKPSGVGSILEPKILLAFAGSAAAAAFQFLF